MNKKFQSYFESNGMTVSGNKAYGVVKGYETNANIATTVNSVEFPYKWFISFFATTDQKAQMEAGLRSAAIKNFKFTMTDCGLILSMTDFTVGRLVDRLPSVFDTVYGIIESNGGKGDGYCPFCGEPLDPSTSKKTDINGLKVTLDSGCVDKMNAVIDQENKDFENAPNNYLRGFMGALVGGAVGIVIAVVLALVGFISAIAAIAAVAVGAFLYRKLGGKPNKMMIVIVGATTLVCMVLAVVIAYLIAAGIAINEVGVDMNVFEVFALCMEDEEFSRMFYLDLVLSMIFAIVGAVAQMFVVGRSIKRKKHIG